MSQVYGQTQKIDFAINLDNTPKISRFKGFIAIIPTNILNLIDKDSLKLYINGEDFSKDLKQNIDAKTGTLYVSFKPKYPLPIGLVVQKLTGINKDGDYFEKSWTLTVDPYSDRELAGYYNTLQKDPSNVQAHMSIAAIYEKKYLLEDAQNEYLTILQLDPSNAKARKSYERIFALWDQKLLKYGALTIDVYMDTGILRLGRLLIFNVKAKNDGEEKTLSIAPDKWILIDETGKQYAPLATLSGYPKKALDSGLISNEDYARLSYYLEKNSFPILKGQDLATLASTQGYVIFTYTGKVKKIVLSITDQDVGDHKETFIFPFTLP